jgi:hypothetical protein
VAEIPELAISEEEEIMDPFDMSAEYLRTRVEQVAAQISQQVAKTPAAEHPFFISDIVNAVENAVGGIVHAAEDAVNEAVNVTHDIVNAVEHVGERVVTATERAVEAVTVHTQQILDVANIATDVVKTVQVTIDVAEAIGVVAETESGAHHRGPTASGASVSQLVQARRAAILEQRKAIINSHLAKRTEIKSKIAAVASRLAAHGSSSEK